MVFDISGSNKVSPEQIECDVCCHEYENIPKSCKNDKCTFNVCKNCISILPTRHSIIEPTRGNRINYKDCPACKTPIEQISRSQSSGPVDFDAHGHCPSNFMCCCLLGHCSVTEWHFLSRCTPNTASCCCLGLDLKFENNSHPAVSRCEVGCFDGNEMCAYAQHNLLQHITSFGAFIILLIMSMCCVKCTGNCLLHIFANHHFSITPGDFLVDYHTGKACMDCCVGFWSLCTCWSGVYMIKECCFNDVVGLHGPCCGSFVTCMCQHPRAILSHEPMERT